MIAATPSLAVGSKPGVKVILGFSMTVDGQCDNNCANTIIDSHLCKGFGALSEIQQRITKGTRRDLS